jgi:uncharacterized protein YndB with AHSA1/START domain
MTTAAYSSIALYKHRLQYPRLRRLWHGGFVVRIDVVGYVGAVAREVKGREHEGRPARVVVATRTYDTSIEDVWDAVTSAERIPLWFLPISGDLRLGGRYQFEGNAGGLITRCEPPRNVAVTWEYGGSTSWVTVSLAEDSKGGTSLELAHIAHAGDAHWDQYGPGAVGVGWDLALMGLALHFATGGAPVDRAESAAWSASPEGKDFMRRSSDDWCRASIAFGTDAEAATAAAKRTAAAYSGEE